MDTLASLALATEDPEESLLDRGPHSRDEYIISKTMLKHIIGQSIYQLIIILIIVFLGEYFIPESVDSYDTTKFASNPEWKWHNGVVGGTVRSGRPYFANGDPDYETIFQDTGTYSRHFTFVFNTFVLLQVFNFVNCRKLHEQVFFLIFSSIHSEELQKIPSSWLLLEALSFFRSSWLLSPEKHSESIVTLDSLLSNGLSPYKLVYLDCNRLNSLDSKSFPKITSMRKGRSYSLEQWRYWQKGREKFP